MSSPEFLCLFYIQMVLPHSPSATVVSLEVDKAREGEEQGRGEEGRGGGEGEGEGRGGEGRRGGGEEGEGRGGEGRRGGGEEGRRGGGEGRGGEAKGKKEGRERK